MSDGFTAMSHENDGGQCWCGPRCGPIAFAPLSNPWRSVDLQQLVDERLNDNKEQDE